MSGRLVSSSRLTKLFAEYYSSHSGRLVGTHSTPTERCGRTKLDGLLPRLVAIDKSQSAEIVRQTKAALSLVMWPLVLTLPLVAYP